MQRDDSLEELAIAEKDLLGRLNGEVCLGDVAERQVAGADHVQCPGLPDVLPDGPQHPQGRFEILECAGSSGQEEVPDVSAPHQDLGYHDLVDGRTEAALQLLQPGTGAASHGRE